MPVRGEYNDLKSYLVTNLILPEYKKTIDSRMELSAIRDSHSRDTRRIFKLVPRNCYRR